MWFKNLIIYRLPAGWSLSAAELETRLSNRPLQPCNGFDLQTRGWVSPAGDGRFLRSLDGHHLLTLGVNQKLLPASIVNQMAKERAAVLAGEQGHPVGRRQLRDLKEQVRDELRARALTRRHEMRAWIDPQRLLLIVDCASAAKAEELVETLRDTLDGLAVQPLESEPTPGAAMRSWLMSGHAPGRFTIEEDLELQARDDSKSAIRYVRHPLDGKEIQKYLSAGRRVALLGLSWNARLTFVLDAQLQIKRLRFLFIENDAGADQSDREQQFDVDFALMTGEVGMMLDELLRALGNAEQRDRAA